MATKQELVKMAEEEKTGSAPAPEVLQAKSVAEASTNAVEEQPTIEKPEEVEATEATSVAEKEAADADQVSVIADEKHEEAVKETSVDEEPKETVEEAPAKAMQEESIEEHEKKEEVVEKASAEELARDAIEKDGVTNGSTEQTQGQGDGVGGVAVTKDEETASETVQERGVDAVAEPEEESVKDAEMVKESEDQTKEETPVKPVKQSSNLISKVKSSLVKAKKAIIGKSPPKSDAAETKE